MSPSKAMILCCLLVPTVAQALREPPATCAGSCGGEAAAGCSCAPGCEAFGDCCPDYQVRCPPPAPTCATTCTWSSACDQACPRGDGTTDVCGNHACNAATEWRAVSCANVCGTAGA